MAEDRSVGGLFLRLGLSLSELETGFVNAQQTIAANINRLNREAELVRIRSEIEIAGLDETADAERILQVRQEALNRQMEIQRDRVRILDAELQNLIRTQGENSVAAQRATTTLERARLALANMERQSRELADTQSQTNEGIGELNNLLPTLSPRLQAVAKVFAGIATASGAAGMSVKELLEDFRELQTQSYELNMPFDKTRDFLRELNLSGGDIGDIEGYIRGITDAWTKGEYDDPEFIALRKYDAKITDSTGRLKDFKDILDEVYQAWKRADEAGEGIEFLQMTGGESGVRDVIQYFKRHDEILEDSAKLVKAGFSAAEMHELDRAMKLVEAQSKELKDALGDIFVPAAQSAAEQFFETLQAGTKILVENKDEIQSWGFIAAETVKTIKGAFSEAGDKIAELDKRYRADDEALKNLSWRYGGSTSNPYGVDKMIKGMTTPEETKPHDIISGIIERAKKEQEKYNAELAKTQKKFDELNKEQGSPLNQYAEKRIQQFKDELEDLRIDLDIEDEFARARAHLQAKLNRESDRKNFLSKEEEKAFKDLGQAQMEQIDRAQKAAIAKAHEEAAAKIQEYWNNAADIEFELTHTAFEKQIRDIEQWEQAQRDKADTAEEIAGIIAESAAKEAQAFEREVERIKGVTKSLEDEIFDMEHSQYESDIRRAMQKYQKALEDGVDFSVAQRWLNDKLKGFNTRAKESKASDGDYTKNPNGTQSAIQWGGLSLSLPTLQRGISLMTDENQIRRRLITTLDEAAQAEVERIQSLKNISYSMPQMPIPDNFQGVPIGNSTIIEGDEVTQISLPDLKAEMEKMQRQMAETFGVTMPDISQYMPAQSSVQLPAQETMTFETIVTPLNNIHTVVSNILSALDNRQPAQITVSPTNQINLGGAYVFDNAMKKQLVDDITSEVVDEITQAVTQATSRANYSYGA